MRCYEHGLDQFTELLRARMLIDRAVTVDKFCHKVNCEYEPVSLSTHAVLPIITECKYYNLSIYEVIVGTNHIVERTLIHLGLRFQCVSQQFILGHKHSEVFLLSQVRDEHTLNKTNDLIWHCFAGLLQLLEICSSNPFLHALDIVWSPWVDAFFGALCFHI